MSNITNKLSEDSKVANWAFFGSSDFSVTVLEVLKENHLLPNLIITIEDKFLGRGMKLKYEEVKVWAKKEAIPCLQLKTLKTEESKDEILKYFLDGADFFLVTHYGKMIPKNILDIPKHGTLNIHPSLLPRLRGPSPIKSAILGEKETGVTIIKLDAEMDHGPILAQEKIITSIWPPYEEELSKSLAILGGELFTRILPVWLNGEISGVEQKHDEATFCKKIEKIDALLNLDDDAELNLRKIRAYHKWPGAYFYYENVEGKKRIVVRSAKIENDRLVLERIVPEGKKEMGYEDFLRGIKS